LTEFGSLRMTLVPEGAKSSRPRNATAFDRDDTVSSIPSKTLVWKFGSSKWAIAEMSIATDV